MIKINSPLLHSFALAVACLLLTCLTSCAFLNRDNTLLLNAVEDNLWPEETAMRVLAFPVVFPCGLAAICVDTIVIHPISIIDDAANDTYEHLWDEWDWENHYVTECASLPWRCAFTPVWFSCDFLARAFFDVTESAKQARRATEADEQDEKQAAIRNARRKDHIQAVFNQMQDKSKSMSTNDKIKQIEMLNRLIYDCIDGMDPIERRELVSRYRGIVLQASFDYGCYDLFDRPSWLSDIEMGGPDEQTYCLINEKKESPNALNRWIAILYCFKYPEGFDPLKAQIHSAFCDKSPVVRHATLTWIQRNNILINHPDLFSVLNNAADKETDSINSSLFRAILSR